MNDDERRLLVEVALAIGGILNKLADDDTRGQATLRHMRDTYEQRVADLTMRIADKGSPTP